MVRQLWKCRSQRYSAIFHNNSNNYYIIDINRLRSLVCTSIDCGNPTSRRILHVCSIVPVDHMTFVYVCGGDCEYVCVHVVMNSINFCLINAIEISDCYLDAISSAQFIPGSRPLFRVLL